MSRRCDICGRGPVTGNRVSHSEIKTRRRWLINLQPVRVLQGGNAKRLRVCTRCLRSGRVVRAV